MQKEIGHSDFGDFLRYLMAEAYLDLMVGTNDCVPEFVQVPGVSAGTGVDGICDEGKFVPQVSAGILKDMCN